MSKLLLIAQILQLYCYAALAGDGNLRHLPEPYSEVDINNLLNNFWLKIKIPAPKCNFTRWNIKPIIEEVNSPDNLFTRSSVVIVYIVFHLETMCANMSSTDCGLLIKSSYHCYLNKLNDLLINGNSTNLILFSKLLLENVKLTQNFKLPNVTGISNEKQVKEFCTEYVERVLGGQGLMLLDVTPVHLEDRRFLETFIINKYGANGSLTYRGLKSLLHDLKIGGVDKNQTLNITVFNKTSGRFRRHDWLHHVDPYEFTSRCLKASDFYHLYTLDEDEKLDESQLQKFCPIFIQQIINGSCTDVTQTEVFELVSDLQKYGLGSVAVFVISLCAIIGIFLVPLMSSTVYDVFLMGFIALGVGTLAGDAILHLIPQCLGLHTHKRHRHIHHPPSDGFPIYIWVSLVVLGAIYILFFMETMMQLVLAKSSPKRKKSEGDGHGHSHKSESNGHGHSHIPDIFSFRNMKKKNKPKTDEDDSSEKEPKPKNGEITSKSWKTTSEFELTSADVNPTVNVQVQEEPEFKIKSTNLCKGLTTLSLVIILGDAIHNVADGLAVGAAFSTSINHGISVSIAILCHEIPHELADFAILLSTGMTYKKALACNLVGALTAFIGLYVGCSISEDETSRKWIFAIAAGMFLYVALGDLMMELIHPKKGFNWSVFVIENVGMLTGMAIMLLIALYEDKISVRLA